MRILSLTAGAATMYCGSCMRDNALAAELIRLGHEVTLLPFYTPTLTDEENVSRQQQVFFGGISVYLEQHLPWYRRAPRFVDRLLDSPNVIKAFTRGSISVDAKQLGALTVSTLRGEEGHQRREIEKLLDFLKDEPRPDVVNIPYTLLICLAAPIRRLLNCPIVMTLQGEDLFLEGMIEPFRTEALDLVRSRIGDVDLFIAVSDYYARFMRDYLRIPESKMRVGTLGVNTSDLTISPRRRRDPFTIGYFARVAPEKGLHNLADAYRILRAEKKLPPSRLLVAGYLPPEQKPYLEAIAEGLRGAGLGEEFVYRGALDRARKVQFFHNIDVLSVPSPYREPKGLYLLEAMACGVPVVQPNHGAFPEVIGRTGGGVLAKSETGADIAEALEELWKNPARLAELGRRGAEGVRRNYTVTHMAEQVVRIYQEVAGAGDTRGAGSLDAVVNRDA
jgi:glycosyltransferase involved in cell wall biosynthesis